MRDADGPAVPDRQADVAVVGAGWAGLAAAVELTRAGRRVLVLDAAPEAGGRARAIDLRLGGIEARIDNGQHLMIGAYRECLRLAAQVGVRVVTAGTGAGRDGARDGDRDGPLEGPRDGDGDRARGADCVDPARPATETLQRFRMRLIGTDGFDLAAAPLPAPLHLLVGLIAARGLSAGERWAAARLMWSLRAQRWRTPPGETVAELLLRLGQPESLRRRLWEPLAVGALNTAADAACAQVFAAVLRDSLGADARACDFILPAGTLSDAFPTPACRWLERQGAVLRMRTAVRGMANEDGRWRIDSDRGAWHAASVVLAVPPPAAARLLAPIALSPGHRNLVAALDRFAYESIATVYLAWPQQQCGALPRWIMLDDRAAPHAWGQWLFDRGVQRGVRIAAVVVSARGRLADVTPDALAEGIARQVSEQLRVPLPVEHRAIVEKRATFRCVPDRPALTPRAFVDADRPPSGSPAGIPPACAGLYLAGDHACPEYPATLESAVRSGVEAARSVIGARPPTA